MNHECSRKKTQIEKNLRNRTRLTLALNVKKTHRQTKVSFKNSGDVQAFYPCQICSAMFSRCNVSKKKSLVFHIVNFLNNCNYNENDCFFSNNNNYIQHVATRRAIIQSQQWKHQISVRNLLTKLTKTTPNRSQWWLLCCLYC